MNTPVFLALDTVLLIHQLSIEQFGGTLGIRDEGGLESAVFHPRNVWFYGGDLFDVAAAYVFHIAEAQCFLDGNKRTAVGAGINFLYANGLELATDDLEFYQLVIAIAEKRASKQDLARFLKEHAIPRK